MPFMNFDLEDGLPPVSFTLKVDDADRFMAFMAECQQIRDSEKSKPASQQPVQAKLPSFIAQQADRALDDAIHPKGMHTNGNAIVQMEASQFAILLKYAKGIAIPSQTKG